jgi:hypothetical protein
MLTPGGIAENAKRSIIVSSSAAVFVNSLDKPALFPPPVKVITKYANVHHARVFGCHLFNVDLGNARRGLPQFFESKQRKQYESGCPFFKDRQHEFLIMPCGDRANVVGILVWAPNISECYVWSKDGCLPNGAGKAIDLYEFRESCLKEGIPAVFADELGFDGINDLDDPEMIADAVGAAGQAVSEKIREEGIESVVPRKMLQTRFADLSDKEIARFLTFFDDAGGGEEELKLYRDQLRAIKDAYAFDTLYDCSHDGM